jgi:hypothetical protein
MSEHFETRLREGTARVAGSLSTLSAAAVREHAERRARRAGARTVAIAAAAVLVVGGAAFGLERQGGGTAGAASSSASATAASASTATATPNPSQYVAGAWLSESRLPYAGGAITWQVDPQDLGTKLNGAVQLALPNSGFFDSSVGDFGTYCSINALADAAAADQEESFDGTITGSSVPSTPGIPARARQSTVFYRTQSDATAAWAAIGSGFAACAAFETGSVSGESKTYPSTGTATQIVNEPGAQCWTNQAAVKDLGPAVTDLLDDVCFVQHGTLISSFDLGFQGPAALSAVDFGAVDAPIVADLQQALNAYDHPSSAAGG